MMFWAGREAVGDERGLIESNPGQQRMTYRWFFAAAILVQGGAQAQWLNYSPSGTPMKDGKPVLTAPAPRAADGKPDLTGVWAHEKTPVSEWKRMLGPAYEKESQSALLGMELEVVHKYGLNIFSDLTGSISPPRLNRR